MGIPLASPWQSAVSGAIYTHRKKWFLGFARYEKYGTMKVRKNYSSR